MIRLRPNDGTIKRLEGMICEKTGNTLSAKQYYENALSQHSKELALIGITDKRHTDLEVDKALDLIMLGHTKEGHDILQKLYDDADEKNKWQYKEWLTWTRNDFLQEIR